MEGKPLCFPGITTVSHVTSRPGQARAHREVLEGPIAGQGGPQQGQGVDLLAGLPDLANTGSQLIVHFR